jgi:predicted esterase
MPEATVHTIGVTTHGRFLMRPPAAGTGRVAVVGFHGYMQGAQDLLDELERLPGAASWLLVSVQGLHRFYDRGHDTVVASWMTSQDRELAIADNLAYVDAVVAAVRAAHPFERLVFLGFSQGASMASRAAGHVGEGCHGLVMLAGDIAPEVRAGTARLPRTIIGRGTRDALFAYEAFARDRDALEERGALAAAIEFKGGHEFADTFRAAAGALISALA